MSLLLQPCKETISNISKNLKILKTTQLSFRSMFSIRFRKLGDRKSDHLELPSYNRATKWGLHWQLIPFHLFICLLNIFLCSFTKHAYLWGEECLEYWEQTLENYVHTQPIPFCFNSAFENFPTFPNSPGWITEAARECLPKIFQGVHDSEDSEYPYTSISYILPRQGFNMPYWLFMSVFEIIHIAQVNICVWGFF